MFSHTASKRDRLWLFVVAGASVNALWRGGAGQSTPALAGDTIPQVCPIYQGGDVPKAIPHNDVNGVTSTPSIVAPSLRIINVSVRLNLITHPEVGDLRLRLLAPDQTSITLIGDSVGPTS